MAVDDQLPSPPPSSLKRAGRAFFNVTLVLALVVVASLIGLGGAALFIYKQMGNHVSFAKTDPTKQDALASDPDPKSVPVQSDMPAERHAATPTVAESTEWHFAEFSDQPRYIDVTYDGGRQHARLKVNTVLSSKSEGAPSAFVSDDTTEDDASQSARTFQPARSPQSLSASESSGTPPLGAGSRYILDPDTGRVVGIDSTAAAAMEVRRAQPVSTTIRNPVPEVRVASPVMQFGRPIFDGDRPVQAAVPVDNRFLPTRKALPVNLGDAVEANDQTVSDASADGLRSSRRATPVLREPTAKEYEQVFGVPARTPVFRRDRSGD